RIYKFTAPQRLDRILINRVSLALPNDRRVRDESEPLEVVENRVFVTLAAALTVVILDAQQHATARVGTGSLPHLDRVEHVTEMQVTRRRRRKPGDHRHNKGL